MRFFLSIATFASLTLMGLLSVGCSDDKATAGIEIGNPSIDSPVANGDTSVLESSSSVSVANPCSSPSDEMASTTLPLTACFVVDYGKGTAGVLAKVAASEKPIVLDSFGLDLVNVRTYNSTYSHVLDTFNLRGMTVWPYEGAENEVMPVSFTDNSYIDESFRKIDLLPEPGVYLKEIGVSFKLNESGKMHGRLLVDGEYVSFVYSMSYFKALQLRYHYSQLDIDSTQYVANLMVKFRAKRFIENLDFAKAETSDGVIVIDEKNNVDLWDSLNARFIPSFQPLRYKYLDSDEQDSVGVENVDRIDYVDDVWKNIAADVNENTVINGNFKSPFTADWILVTQFGGKADTTVIVENEKERIMKVDVTDGGDSSFSVQLLQENVALIEGVRYKCVFTIWSDVADSITARIGSYDTYETVGFSKHVFVNTSGASVQEEFVAKKSDPFARFELNLGKKKRWFKIKDVQVIRLSK